MNIPYASLRRAPSVGERRLRRRLLSAHETEKPLSRMLRLNVAMRQRGPVERNEELIRHWLWYLDVV